MNKFTDDEGREWQVVGHSKGLDGYEHATLRRRIEPEIPVIEVWVDGGYAGWVCDSNTVLNRTNWFEANESWLDIAARIAAFLPDSSIMVMGKNGTVYIGSYPEAKVDDLGGFTGIGLGEWFTYLRVPEAARKDVDWKQTLVRVVHR